MSSIHVCFSTKPNCWNFEAKCYGTCYGCGCCVKDKAKLYKNRIAYLNEMLNEQYEFDGWDDDPELKALQERNVKANIRYFKRLKRYYEKKLKEMDEVTT